MNTKVRDNIDRYARQRMARQELITWRVDDERNVVSFWVPSEVDTRSYPSEIEGMPVVVHRLPRPHRFNALATQ